MHTVHLRRFAAVLKSSRYFTEKAKFGAPSSQSWSKTTQRDRGEEMNPSFVIIHRVQVNGPDSENAERQDCRRFWMLTGASAEQLLQFWKR